MKLMRKVIVGVSIAAVMPQIAFGAVAYRTAVIDELQMTAKVLSTDPPLVHVAQSGSWSASVSCPLDWVYFNSADNPHFTATLIAAGIADRVVRIYVDDTLPKVSGFCQVKYVSLLPAT